MVSTNCALCDKPALLTCSKCLSVSYCCQECQKIDWKLHKKTCNKPKEFVTISDDIMALLENDDLSALTSALKTGAVDLNSVRILNEVNKMNLLTCACVSNALEIVTYLLHIHRYNLDVVELSNGSTALMDACAKGRIDLALLLISCGANSTLLNANGISAFDMIGRGSKVKLSKSAVAEFRQRCVKAVVKCSCDIPSNSCAVCQAPAILKCNQCDSVYYCGSGHQAEDWRMHKAKCMSSDKYNASRYHLRNAISCKDSTQISEILGEYPQMLNDARPPIDKAPLHLAVCQGHAKILKLLIDKGADVDLLEKEGCTPLMFACQLGRVGLVKLLLDASADLNIFHGKLGSTALMMAAENGDTIIVTMLLQAGANPNYSSMRDGGSALLVASLRNQVKVVRALLDGGADVNICMKNGVSSLMMATFKNHVDIVKMLLEANADITFKDEHGRSALMAAVRFGHKEIATLLMAKY